MNDNYYFGRMAYIFLILCEGISVFITGFFTHRFSVQALVAFMVYFCINILVLTQLHQYQSVSEGVYNKLQMISFLLLAVWLCYACDNVYVLLLAVFLQAFLGLLFLDRGLYQFQMIISCIGIIAIGLWGMPGITRKPTTIEYIFSGLTLLMIDWLAVNLIKRLEFQVRKSVEQERSLDDMLKVVEVKRDEAKKAASSKAEFLSNMSHEIRTPINAVLGMNEMILRESGEKQILKYAANIESSGKMLLSLINDILDFSKIESGRMEIIPVGYQLNSMVNDLVNMIVPRIKEKQLKLEVKVEPDVPNYLYGDEVRIRQIVTNLLTNAVKYTEKGCITLHVDFRRSESRNIDLIFEVKDTGVGIKQNDIGKLFESFQRVDQKNNRNIEGSGLGLAITHQFVELMHGRVDVESEYGIGSTFTAVIPQKVTKNKPVGDYKANYERGAKKNAVYRESFHAPDAKVLIVDDNEMNLVVAESLLKQTQIQIETAASGTECLEKLRKASYHVLLLDHMMPGLDGVETLKAIKQEGIAPDMPIIALTANAISGAREKYLEYGFQDYLAKPIVGMALERLLSKWLPEELQLTPEAGEASTIVEAAPTVEKQAKVSEDARAKARALQMEAVLEKMVDRQCGLAQNDGSEAMYREALTGFWKQGAKNLYHAQEALSKKEWGEYAKLLQVISETAEKIGAVTLAKEADRLCVAGKEERIEEVTADKGEVLQLYKEVLKAVRYLLDKEKEVLH